MMTASPVNFMRQLSGTVVMASLMAALSASVWAQQTPAPAPDVRTDDKRLYMDGVARPLLTPTPIIPGPYVSKGSVKVEDRERLLQTTVAERDPEPLDEALQEQDEDKSTFEMGELEEIDPGTFGLLDEGTGGLPHDLWRGTPRDALTAAVAGLPTATRSPEVNALVRRLLVSSFDIPAVEEGGDAGDYIRLRARKLADTGHLPDLVAFLDAMPDVANDPSLLRLQADAALLSGDNLRACQLIERGRSLEGATHWVKMDTYCSALQGREGVVAFNLTLLAETASPDDIFIGLINDVLARASGRQVSEAVPAHGANAIDVLTYALYVAADRVLPIEKVKDAAPLVLSAAAMRGDISDEKRLELATAAARRGLFLTDDLVGLSLSLPFTQEELSSASLLADDPADARTDALLLQAGLAAESNFSKANMLNLAWSRAQAMGDELVLSQGFHRVVKEIVPERPLLFFASDAARIALSASDFEGAMGWYELAVAAAIEGDLEGTRILMGLWPFILISDEENATPYSPEVLELWRQGLNVLERDEARARARYLYAVVEVFGHHVPQSMWDALDPDSAPIEVQMESGSEEASVTVDVGDLVQDAPAPHFGTVDIPRGEMLAKGLSVLGEAGPRGVDGKVLAEALTALKQAGYEDVARRLAIEALIGRGF